VVGALEIQGDESRAYLDPEAGEIHLVELGVELDVEKLYLLPDKREIHEWEILNAFAHAKQGRAGRDLLDAVHGRGAFRAFRAAVERRGLREEWFAFRTEAFREIARAWLEKHGLAWRGPARPAEPIQHVVRVHELAGGEVRVWAQDRGPIVLSAVTPHGDPV